MTAFEFRALLSRLDPRTQLLVTVAPLDGHGSFAAPVVGVSQDRTLKDGTPVVVLHFAANAKDWAARAHGKSTPRFMLLCSDDHYNTVGIVSVYNTSTETLDKDWANGRCVLFRSDYRKMGELGWRAAQFDSVDEATVWANHVGLRVISVLDTNEDPTVVDNLISANTI